MDVNWSCWRLAESALSVPRNGPFSLGVGFSFAFELWAPLETTCGICHPKMEPPEGSCGAAPSRVAITHWG